MTEKTETKEVKEEINYNTISQFLEATPPNQLINIFDLTIKKKGASIHKYNYFIHSPELQLHCPHESCNGVRFFRCVSGHDTTLYDSYRHFYLTYKCSNCRVTDKTYSLAAKIDQSELNSGLCLKFGEMPVYGPPVPPKLVKLIGPDRDEFLKGRRCENQGLGIGAFIYYRRVVENQKNRILEKIIKVSEKIDAPPEKIKILKNAIEEIQFSKALEMTKDALPESLLINGHNPILLLHSALSEGVHAMTDEECLELASSVRVVLGELSDRLSQALKNEVNLTNALSTLMHHKQKR